MNIDLKGKRALVTGGDSGIGAAISKAFAEAGAALTFTYNSKAEQANELAKELGESVSTVQLDISDAEAVTNLFTERFTEQPLDILVNNAGLDGKRALSWEIQPDDWRKVLEVNLFGPFYCAREALKLMVPRKEGVILNMTSVHEKVAWSGYSAYATAKAGLSMLSKTLAQEAAASGVRVLALAPGAIKTSINQDVWDDPDTLADLKTKIAMQRMGDVDEIARIATILVSDAASYVTGTTVFVDGGMTDYPAFTRGG